LLDALAQQGEARATVLSGQLPVSRRAIVKHLAILDRAGLVGEVAAARRDLPPGHGQRG